ncbi:MAG: NADPH:quinone oxidoreductase [Flammeovirgaceae bacterium]|nr:NADPH:quinone oxidoreductase [Flammeovirgaceae bacterium]
MKYIEVFDQDGLKAMKISEQEAPKNSDFEVKIAVYAVGVNRADILQRLGKYPVPEGVSPTLGLEVAGEIVAIGCQVQGFKKGDRVMALLAGGGYAQFTVVDYRLLMPIPKHLDYIQAAGIPEVFLTAYQTLFILGGVRPKEQVLIHAGASGVGTAAIQLAHVWGAQVSITAGSDEKVRFCEKLGADKAYNYKTQSWSALVWEDTEGKGIDVILDCVGGDYVEKNIDCAAFDGRIVLIGFMANARAQEINLAKILQKRIVLKGSTLRARSLAYKSDLINSFNRDFKAAWATKELKPIIDQVLPWELADQAHQRMKQNLNKGKIILTIS